MRANDSQSPEDAISRFCEDLSVPLEQLANVVYLGIRSTSEPQNSKYYLGIADELLADIREQVRGSLQKKGRITASRVTERPTDQYARPGRSWRFPNPQTS